MEKDRLFAYDWHIDEDETEITCIRVYGINEANENVCLRIDDFTPYAYIELPDRIPWDQGKAQIAGNKIDELLGNQKPLKKELMMKKRLYGAELNEKGQYKLFPYLFCSFSSSRDIKTLRFKLRRNLHIIGVGSVKLKLHETDADPILQLTCCRNIPTAGWINFAGKKVLDDKITLCDHEYKVRWKNLAPHNSDFVAKPKIMGFDIEVNSTNPSTMPQATRPGDKVFQISCVFCRYGDKADKYEKYLLTLGQPDQEVVGEDVLVYMYDTESDLLEGFTDLIREENPNIIVGYNILGFDIPYMIERARFNMCIFNFDKQGFHKYNHARERTIKWSSSAYKNQEFQFLDSEGRIYVDLLPLVRRDFSFNNYKLKTIADHFLGQTKDPLSVKGIFKCYRIGTKTKENGEYSRKAQRAMGIVGKYCFAEDTVVSGKHGNIPIQNLYKKNTDVLSWNEQTNMIQISTQYNFFDNGEKECIQLELEDGRTIICTPDHQLATQDGWVNAEDIPVGNMIKTGPILPNIELDTYETIYARILGYMITDGHISMERCVAYCGNLMDAKILADDIKIISGIYPNIRKARNCWVVVLPKNIRAKINQEKWIIGGNRTKSNETLPDISNWSKPQIREFLAGIFGGDGWCPSWNKKDDKFTPIGLTQSRTNIEVLKQYIEIISNMLKMFSIDTSVRISKRDSLYIGSLSLKINDMESFMTNIGYRYCYHKTIRATVAVIYYRIRNKTIKSYVDFYNKVKSSQLSIAESYRKYVDNYMYPPTYGTMKSWIRKGFPEGRPDQACRTFPKVSKFLEYNALTYLFIGDSYHTYSMSKDSVELPVFSLKLVSRTKVGMKQVYDISVNETHSLLANGIVAHNCIQDSALVCLLMDKLQTWVGLSEMAKTCNVKIFTLYTQGQQIKVYSQLYKYCMSKNIVVENDAYQVSESERYVGAHVFPPVPGRYKNVVPFDFSSLYPTTIIAYNIDYHTWVKDDSNIPDSMCHVMEWSDHVGCIHDPKVIRAAELGKYIETEREKIKKMREKRAKLTDKLRKKEMMDEINQKLEELKPYTTERSELTKSKSKHPMCSKRYYRFLKEPKGVLPTIIQNLLDARKHTRKVDMKKINNEIKELEVEEKEKGIDNSSKITELKSLLGVLDKRQLAYKVSANSMYGAMGVRRGYLPFMPGAMCTCYMGRVNIERVAKTVVEKYGGELVYGDTDCCRKDTPVIVKSENSLICASIDDLSDGEWTKLNEFKEISKPKNNYSIWSDNGFTPIKCVVRCRTKKPVCRVLTHVGIVECSQDHSLLRENLEQVSSTDLNVGDKLCITELPLPKDTPAKPLYNNKITDKIIEEYVIPDITVNGLSAELAFVWGLFYADGSCGVCIRKNGHEHYTWQLNNSDFRLLERCIYLLGISYTDMKFKILDTMKSSAVYKLSPNGNKSKIADFVMMYRCMFYDCRKYKKVPNEILNAPFGIRQSFFMGYYAGDGSKKDPAVSCSNKGTIGTAGLFFLMRSIGYKVSINTRSDKADVYKLTASTPEQKFRYDSKKVKKLIPFEIPEDEYIYDIQTENHHFAAGIGQIVVHNSNYIHFPSLEDKTTIELWDYAEYVAEEVTKLFPPPINFGRQQVAA